MVVYSLKPIFLKHKYDYLRKRNKHVNNFLRVKLSLRCFNLQVGSDIIDPITH